MNAPPERDRTAWPFPFSQPEWDQTLPAVQAYILTLQQELRQLAQRVETLEARLQRTSKTSNQPLSADSPYRKAGRSTAAGSRQKSGGTPGHRGSRQPVLPATAAESLYPGPCSCGATDFYAATLYYTHQVIELPPIQMEVTHFVLYQARCLGCGQLTQAQIPPEYATGYGSRFTALMGELAGAHGSSRRLIQDFCASVLRVPISLGALQKVIDRVAQAITPHYAAIATQARQARVNYIDETPWFLSSALQWLWVMVSESVAFYMIHPQRSKEAFAALIDDWAGMLVSDGYRVYQSWVAQRKG